jgi:drug/metabolite transporter (DMT)-like permease
MKTNIFDIKLFFITSISLLFLGLNSIFCKAVLVNNDMDAYSFTFFRLFFAAITLVVIYLFKTKKFVFSTKSNWISSFMLFLYAVCFSYSYLSIEAGFGTLLLFGVVQIVMMISSFFYKEKISIQKIVGLVISFFGLAYLLFPKESFEVSYFYSFLMIISGIAWAFYTILGKKSSDSLFNTMDNFIKATLFVILFYFLFVFETLHFTSYGLFFAFISGSITSALGYVLWYEVLPKIDILTAGIIQLFVPIISIIVSIIFLSEVLTINLVISTVLVSIGIIISLYSKKIK